MKNHKIHTLIIAAISVSLLTGFGFGDLKKSVMPDTDKCKGKSNSERKKCEKNENMKSIGKVAIIAGSAALIYKMTIGFKSKKTTNDTVVIKKYKKKFTSLPSLPVVIKYTTSLKPGDVVKIGKEVLIVSELEVVPGNKSNKVSIQEKITIFDNEDNSKVLKALTKNINQKDKKTGAFKNEFKFTLPVGMPQGIYPIKTVIILDKKEQKSIKNNMQLVLEVKSLNEYNVIVLNN